MPNRRSERRHEHVNVASGRGLVLAGGGIAGIAWETGILRGISDESPAAARLLLDSDVLVGTSAGSAVAAQIGTGGTLEALFDRQVAETSAEIDSGVDIATITELFLAALQEPYVESPDKTREQMRRIGALAAGTETVPEAFRRQVIAQRLPSHDWPERRCGSPRSTSPPANWWSSIGNRESGWSTRWRPAVRCPGRGRR